MRVAASFFCMLHLRWRRKTLYKLRLITSRSLKITPNAIQEKHVMLLLMFLSKKICKVARYARKMHVNAYKRSFSFNMHLLAVCSSLIYLQRKMTLWVWNSTTNLLLLFSSSSLFYGHHWCCQQRQFKTPNSNNTVI